MCAISSSQLSIFFKYAKNNTYFLLWVSASYAKFLFKFCTIQGQNMLYYNCQRKIDGKLQIFRLYFSIQYHFYYNYINMISSIEQAASNIPLLTIHAGPKDQKWKDRLREELKAIITYVKANKQQDNDWFKIEPSKDGTKWQGVCSYTHNLVRYEFKLQFQVPATYPSAPIELELPQLQGKTIKMYRGGKICQDIHFAPLWAKHSPKLGIAHALAMALGPWLAAEVPNMVKQGKLLPK